MISIQNHCTSLSRIVLQRALPAGLLVVAMLSGCSLIDAKKDDYKRASRLPPLEIPPSLSVPQADDRYTIPDPKDVAASATYSEYARSRGLPTLPGGYVPGVGVDPLSAQAHIERAGAERWLVVNGTPEQVWATTRTFLTENGYEIAAENPTLGVLETQWVTNKPQVEDDGVFRNLINSLFTNDNSTSLRDRYRFRVEHGRKEGTTEIFVTHKGLEEVVVANTDRLVWQPRASEPDKEAEMLKRLLVKFGVDLPAAAQAVVAAKVEPRAASASDSDVASGAAVASSVSSASFDTGAAGEPRLLLNDTFDRAWRRVGLAIDKSGLGLQDQDRDEGVYFVQYSADKVKDPTGASKEKKGVGGILASLGRSIWKKLTDTDTSTPSKDKPVDLTPGKDLADIKVPDGVYRLAVSHENGSQAHISVLDKDGKAPAADVARKVLSVLANELR